MKSVRKAARLTSLMAFKPKRSPLRLSTGDLQTTTRAQAGQAPSPWPEELPFPEIAAPGLLPRFPPRKAGAGSWKAAYYESRAQTPPGQFRAYVFISLRMETHTSFLMGSGGDANPNHNPPSSSSPSPLPPAPQARLQPVSERLLEVSTALLPTC